MMRKILRLILCTVLATLLLSLTAAASDATFIVGNEEYNMALNRSGQGWSWDSQSCTLTLNGYQGGKILLRDAATVVTAAGSQNTITTSGFDIGLSGSSYELTLRVEGSLNITSEADGICAGRLNITVASGAALSSTCTGTSSDALQAESSYLTLQNDGTVELTAQGKKCTGMRANNDVTLSGSGTTTIDADSGIFTSTIFNFESSGKLTINCSYNDSSTSGFGIYVSKEGQSRKVKFNGAGAVTIRAKKYALYLGNTPIVEFNGLTSSVTLVGETQAIAISSSYASQPKITGKRINDYTVTGAWNSTSMTFTTEGYPFWVCGTKVTAATKDDILNDGGSMCFDPATVTLTLTNASLPAGSGCVENGCDTALTVLLSGSNSFANCYLLSQPGITLDGGGTLTFANATSKGAFDLYGDLPSTSGGTLWIKNARVTLTNCRSCGKAGTLRISGGSLVADYASNYGTGISLFRSLIVESGELRLSNYSYGCINYTDNSTPRFTVEIDDSMISEISEDGVNWIDAKTGGTDYSNYANADYLRIYSVPVELSGEITDTGVTYSVDTGTVKATLIAVRYDENGRLAEVKIISVTGSASGDTGLTIADDSTYKIFLLSEDSGKPLCSEWVAERTGQST